MPKTHAVTQIQELLRFLNNDKSIAIHRLISAGIRTTTPAKLITENKTNNTVRTHKTINKVFDNRFTSRLCHLIECPLFHDLNSPVCR